jgi:hypothetical protein
MMKLYFYNENADALKFTKVASVLARVFPNFLNGPEQNCQWREFKNQATVITFCVRVEN